MKIFVQITSPEHRTAVLVYSDEIQDVYVESGYQDVDGLQPITDDFLRSVAEGRAC